MKDYTHEGKAVNMTLKEDRVTHTPGPWKAIYEGIENGESGKYWIMGGDGLNTVTRIDCGKSEPARANAQLIAAAPELLEALKMIKNSVCRCDGKNEATNFEGFICQTCQAIAKAEGRQ